MVHSPFFVIYKESQRQGLISLRSLSLVIGGPIQHLLFMNTGQIYFLSKGAGSVGFLHYLIRDEQTIWKNVFPLPAMSYDKIFLRPLVEDIIDKIYRGSI